MFANFKDQTIQIRKQKLEQFLNQVVGLVPNLLELSFAKDFFEATDNQSLSNPAPPVRVHKRSQSIFIAEFLKKLNDKSLKIKEVVEDFEEIYFASSPELSYSDISLLFSGEGSLEGLLYFCGNCSDEPSNAMCLKLFSKLLSHEDNTASADKCVNALYSISPDKIKSMNLASHIKHTDTSTTKVSPLACNILYQYISGNTQGITNGKEILSDTQALEEYEKWLVLNSLKEPANPELDNTIKQLMMKSIGKVKLTKDLLESSNLSALNDMKELMEQFDSYTGWKSIESTELIDIYTKGQKQFRATVDIASSDIRAVTKYFYNLEKRVMWDPLHYTVLKKSGEYQSVVQRLHECSVHKFKYIEYIELWNLGKSEDRTSVLIIVRSILLPESSVQTVKRVHVNACVYKLTPIKGKIECQVLWKVEEGIENLAEYSMWRSKKMEANIKTLNQCLQQEAIIPM